MSRIYFYFRTDNAADEECPKGIWLYQLVVRRSRLLISWYASSAALSRMWSVLDNQLVY